MALQAEQAGMAEAGQQVQQSPLQAQHAEQHFNQQLAALPALKAKQDQPDNPFGMHHRLTQEPGLALHTPCSLSVKPTPC